MYDVAVVMYVMNYDDDDDDGGCDGNAGVVLMMHDETLRSLDCGIIHYLG